jgi:hypothetical protein
MQEYTVRIDSNGDRCWYKPGTRVLHRLDGPAIEYADGIREWWVDGKRHRLDGPAIEYASGTREWWVDGKLHRLDGPAIERADGSREWWVDGKLHRLDGPAIERADGSREWWIEGEKITEREFLARTQPAQEITIAEIEKLIGHRVKIIDRT